MNSEYYAILAEHLAVIERQHKCEMRLLRQLKRNERSRRRDVSNPTATSGLRLVYSRKAERA